MIGYALYVGSLVASALVLCYLLTDRNEPARRRSRRNVYKRRRK